MKPRFEETPSQTSGDLEVPILRATIRGSITIVGVDETREGERQFDLTVPWLGLLGLHLVVLVIAGVVAGTARTTSIQVIATVVAAATTLNGWRYATSLCREVSVRPDQIAADTERVGGVAYTVGQFDTWDGGGDFSQGANSLPMPTSMRWQC